MNIIRDGIIMAVYLFVIMALYIFTSQPVHTIFTELLGATVAADAATQNTLNTVDTVYLAMFVLLAAVPLIWFIIRMFQREPEWGYRL